MPTTMLVVLLLSLLLPSSHGLAVSRRSTLKWAVGTAATIVSAPALADSDPTERPDSLNVNDYLRTGFVSNPMGVSGQAGKSRPETGVILRDGSEVSRDPRTGDVLAEILLDSSNPSEGKVPILASYSSPWPLAKGSVFDVECRDAKTGDGAFLAVTSPTKGKSIGELDNSFFLNQLFSATGRFSFYGPPTDVKVQKSAMKGDSRVMDVSFSTVSQATQTEIPRKARLAATIPPNSNQAVMLVASASASRWGKKEVAKGISDSIDSFRAIPAPKSSLKVRAKERRG